MRVTAAGIACLALWLGGPVAAKIGSPAVSPVAAAVEAHRFKGLVLTDRGGTTIWQTPPGRCRPPPPQEIVLCHPRDPAELDSPWASVTKQIVATLVMQQVDRGALSLDRRADAYLPALRGRMAAPTIRMLLQHRSGLRNSDDSPKDAAGEPSFYTSGPTGLRWCLKARTTPGGDWRYNNCDYLVLGAILERTTGRSMPALFAEQIARPLGLNQTRFATPTDPHRLSPIVFTPAEWRTLVLYGAAGGLIGPANEMRKIDRALLTGKLLTPSSRAKMWAGDPKLGYMALGQWVFPAPLKGCTGPVEIVERRGGIGRFQARNILIPARDISVIVFTAEADFDFGEIWQGKGFSYDLLSAVACT